MNKRQQDFWSRTMADERQFFNRLGLRQAGFPESHIREQDRLELMFNRQQRRSR